MAPRRPVAGRRPHRLVQPDTAKSLPPGLAQAGGQIRTGDALTRLLQHRRGQLAQPLPRDEYPYEFGPNIPLLPAPLDPVGPSGRAEPRLYEYPVSWNLPGVGNRLIPWRTLREAGDHPLIRSAISVRKQEIAGLDWDITLARRAVDEAQRDQPDKSRLDIERELREKLRPAITQLRAAWRVPDKGNGLTFAEWTSRFLEEHLVLDATPIYPRTTLAGGWYSFEIVDGATIKPLLDHRGGRPLPPEPAYQQIIHGFPRGEFMADTSDVDGQIVIPGGYRADQLIYIQRESRVASPYGLSPVERCLLDLSLWMKRQDWLRAEYDEGTMPAGWLRWLSEDTSAWTPGQIAEYERELNDVYAGNTAARMRWRVLPPGLIPDESNNHDLAEQFKPEFDMHLMKLVLMHFDVTIHELGFPEQEGLGGSGHAEGQDRLNERKGRLPTLRWMASVFTDMSRAHLGMPDELEFSWIGLEDEDWQGDGGDEPSDPELVAAGLMTINEARDKRGQPRFAFPEADKPFITNGGSVSFLEGIEERQEQEKQQQAEQAQAQLEARMQGAPAAGAKPGEKPGGKPGEKPAAKDDAKRAEAKAYRAWSRRESSRPFVLKAIGADDLEVYGIDASRVEVADLGKAPGPAGPGRSIYG